MRSYRQSRSTGPISDGVTNNANAQGIVLYRARIDEVPRRRDPVDHLNPQTMDHDMMNGGRHVAPTPNRRKWTERAASAALSACRTTRQ
jgi:hypothetical protein